jgi:hypothetical protein
VTLTNEERATLERRLRALGVRMSVDEFLQRAQEKGISEEQIREAINAPEVVEGRLHRLVALSTRTSSAPTEEELKIAALVGVSEDELRQRKHQLAEDQRTWNPNSVPQMLRFVARQMRIPLASVLKRREQTEEVE